MKNFTEIYEPLMSLSHDNDMIEESVRPQSLPSPRGHSRNTGVIHCSKA
jgi:hypothetical protein